MWLMLLPHRPRHRRRLPARQLGRHPHRRLPGPTSAAWPLASTTSPGSAGSFIGLILGGILAADQLAAGLPRSRSRSASSARSGPTCSWRSAARVTASPDRLAGQHHVRGRAHPRHGGHHLRHPALRRARHGLDQPASASAASRWASALLVALRVRRDRGSRTRCSGSACSRSGPSPSARSSTFLSALGRGGLMFMLIIWLQGIWLPQHGYSFDQTPLWAGIYMLPADGRHPDRRAAVRLPVRPVRVAAVRHRRDDRRGRQLRPALSCCRSTSPTRSSR